MFKDVVEDVGLVLREPGASDARPVLVVGGGEVIGHGGLGQEGRAHSSERTGRQRSFQQPD